MRLLTLSVCFVGARGSSPLRRLTYFLWVIILLWHGVIAQSLVNYTVVKDDTLWSIASRYGAEVGDIKRLNNLSSDALFIGQVIQVPYSGSQNAPVTMQRSGVVQHTAAPADSFATIATHYSISEETLRRSNPGYDGVLSDAPLVEGLVLLIAPAEGTVVTVQAGQNMLAMALKHGLTVSELSKLNGVKTVQAGQHLFIPASALAAAPATSSQANSNASNNNPSNNAASQSLPTASTTASPSSQDIETNSATASPGAEPIEAELPRNSKALHLETQKALLSRASSLLANYTPPLLTQSFLWPLSGRLTSYYGRRNISVGGNTFHSGLDIATKSGAPIAASRPGTITKAGWGGAYGYVVYIDHGDGSQTRYAHQSQLNVRVNQYVNQGDIIGFVGSTGASTGPHLHFEIRFDGRSVDPLGYLPEQ
ncbi:MAG: peptidoglycan DD-metalloendopeptidase family protein [Trueperaceae bacterium]